MSSLNDVTFLIIDDNDISRSMMRHLLNANKYHVVGEAGKGQIGLALIEKLQPKIVCLDIVMPDLSGLEVLKRIKAQVPQIEVLMVTGNKDRDTVMEAIEHGACGYIVKPFNPETLLRTIEKAVAKVRSQPAAHHPVQPISQPDVSAAPGQA
ncbi:response regulator [Noviherbaspirillum sp. UKPF54]|uniref:response regulator n=1 Tax=Noviherbaspirillum sp. UKPF54 TaxID=2601898 RepID=UPI0011B1A7B2|nr:response regulator [Noviherbaspirillum sp. UKPF54]QDZ29712.1 response regulator [Noviherbaspirillum sp. UKPF54]